MSSPKKPKHKGWVGSSVDHPLHGKQQSCSIKGVAHSRWSQLLRSPSQEKQTDHLVNHENCPSLWKRWFWRVPPARKTYRGRWRIGGVEWLGDGWVLGGCGSGFHNSSSSAFFLLACPVLLLLRVLSPPTPMSSCFSSLVLMESRRCVGRRHFLI